MGADHSAGNAIVAPTDHSEVDGKIELSASVQVTTAVLDTLGMCIFTFRPISEDPALVESMLDLFLGVQMSYEDFKEEIK